MIYTLLTTVLLSNPSWAGAHEDQALQYGADPMSSQPVQRMTLPPVSAGPDMTVYGYQAYWSDDLNTVPWDSLTHIALFDAEAETDGSLTNTSRWDDAFTAVSMGTPYGVRVHLAVTNFDTGELEVLLGSPSARQNLIDNLVTKKNETGVHGINIDFENLPANRRNEMVTFVRDLQAAVGEVVLAVPSVDWSDAWDKAALTQYADLFIMAYGYHWSGSDVAGPTDPMYAGSGTVWDGLQSFSLTRSVDDYIADGANPNRIILGLPLYGMEWPVAFNGVGAPTTGTGSSVVFEAGWDLAAQYGTFNEYDAASLYTFDGANQIWFGDADTVAQRVAWVRDDSNIQGIGFWALHYDGDDPSFWDTIDAETTWNNGGTGGSGGDNPTGTNGGSDNQTANNGGDAPVNDSYQANPGRPFLAYVGDAVALDASFSTGPNPMQVRWTQTQGPDVGLDASALQPVFTVEQAGSLKFELMVGDGQQWSAPATTWVVVIDPEQSDRLRGSSCGCGTAHQGAYGWLLGLMILAGARRRRIR